MSKEKAEEEKVVPDVGNAVKENSPAEDTSSIEENSAAQKKSI
jgi:hypothetical protein